MPDDIDGKHTYAACLDVLGFRGLLERHGDLLVRAYRTLVAASRIAGGLRLEVRVGDAKTGADLGPMTLGFRKLKAPIVFSDSIFLLTQDDSQESLQEICLYANTIMRQAFNANIPLRGAIARGRTWHFPDQHVTVGDSLVQAHGLEQELDFLGIVLDSSLPDTAAAGPAIELATKSGPKALRPVLGIMLEHPPYLPQGISVRDWPRRLEVLRQAAPEHAKAKYENSPPILAAMFAGGAP